MFSLGRGGVRDPRVEGYNTFAGAAIASFMKLRTDMNLAIWKMRLQLADPSNLIQLEMEIEERIDNKYKLLAELQGKNQSEKFKMVKSMTDNNAKIYAANLKFMEGLTNQQSKVLDDAVMVSREYAKKNADTESKVFIDGKLNTLSGSSGLIQQYLRAAQDQREGKVDVKEVRGVLAQITAQYASGLGDALAKDRVTASRTPDGQTGEIAMERAWLYAATEPQGRLQKLKDGFIKAKKPARARDVDNIIANLRDVTNRLRYPGTELDIISEHHRVAKDRDDALAAQSSLFRNALGIMEQGGRVLSPEQIKLEVNKALDISPTLDIIKGSIPRLESRLEDVTTDRVARQMERDRLLTGMGGVNLAFDPFSRRPSRVGDRMEALYRVGEAEQGLRDIAGVGEMTFPPGRGGNFSDFLKTRVADYQDRMDSAGGDKESADFSGLGDIMDQVSKAFKSFGGNLAESDTSFETGRQGLRPGIVSSIGEVIGQYDDISKNPEHRDRAAAMALDIIGQGNAPVSRNYLQMQRFGTPEEKKAAAYNERFIPLKTNIAMVLNPKIESMRASRENDDTAGMVGSIQDIYNTVERMPDDLLGSAGVNIRAAIEDNPVSEDYIGAEPSIYRVAKLIDDQFVSLNNQIVQENEEAESIFEQTFGEQQDE